MPLLIRNDRLLTPAEVPYARRFRAAAQAALAGLVERSKPDYTPPNFVALYRHECPANRDISTALSMEEIYVSSADPIEGVDNGIIGGEDWLGHSREAYLFDGENPGHVNGLGTVEGLPEFGFIYRSGECRKCHRIGISKAGRLVLASERVRNTGRMARD